MRLGSVPESRKEKRSPAAATKLAALDQGTRRRAHRMLAPLYRVWGWLPDPVRGGFVRTGLPYVGGFVLHYRDKHRIGNFAGNLEELKRIYSAADAGRR